MYGQGRAEYLKVDNVAAVREMLRLPLPVFDVRDGDEACRRQLSGSCSGCPPHSSGRSGIDRTLLTVDEGLTRSPAT